MPLPEYIVLYHTVQRLADAEDILRIHGYTDELIEQLSYDEVITRAVCLRTLMKKHLAGGPHA